MVNTLTRDEVEAGEKAEHLFRDYCDMAGITYLYIEQSSYSKSSKLIREQASRPDFLVLEPYKMPFPTIPDFHLPTNLRAPEGGKLPRLRQAGPTQNRGQDVIRGSGAD